MFVLILHSTTTDCFPCLLCVPRLETCTLGCPPRGASSTLRDTDLFIFWGADCLWFVPLLRMFKGTAGWRRACACAHDKADESTPAHTPTYRRAQAVNGELQPDDVQARDGVHDDGDAAGVQLPLLPLPALRSPVWRHALSTPPTPARRCVMWIHGSFVLWGRTACDLCCSYVCLGARWDGDTARARATRTRRRRGYTQHTGRRAQPDARREGRRTQPRVSGRPRAVRGAEAASRRMTDSPPDDDASVVTRRAQE